MSWRTIFQGEVEGRPVKLKEWNDGSGERALQVETNYGEDTILGDVPGAIGVPVTATELMKIDAQTPEDLRKELIENSFSPERAGDISRLAELPKA
ncbi:MAG: hypothetical protein AB1584_04220 [Pseudomonadota bacterium]